MNILITGGAGYIGSTVAWLFVDRGHKVTVIDNLSKGNRFNIPKKSKFLKIDISDTKSLDKYINTKFDVVLHFAAFIDNEESKFKKKLYLNNNYHKSKIFLNFCLNKGIKNFIFSSTAAVYGSSNKPVNEKSKTNPLAPYGKSKLKFEKYLRNNKKKINFVILRYFNVAGVEKKMRCGFEIAKNKGLFNNLCKSFIDNKIFNIFGNNYKTRDGSAVRDFIHVSDLAFIHYRFSQILKKQDLKEIINCGYGVGFTVLEIIREFKFLLNKNIKINFKNKRKNEISFSLADIKKLKKFNIFLNHKKKLFSMISTSVNWYLKRKKLKHYDNNA